MPGDIAGRHVTCSLSLRSLSFSDDGTSVRYIAKTDDELTYRVHSDTLCYVAGAEPYCLLWRYDGARVLLCDQPGGECRIFVRPEALPMLDIKPAP